MVKAINFFVPDFVRDDEPVYLPVAMIVTGKPLVSNKNTKLPIQLRGEILFLETKNSASEMLFLLHSNTSKKVIDTFGSRKHNGVEYYLHILKEKAQAELLHSNQQHLNKSEAQILFCFNNNDVEKGRHWKDMESIWKMFAAEGKECQVYQLTYDLEKGKVIPMLSNRQELEKATSVVTNVAQLQKSPLSDSLFTEISKLVSEQQLTPALKL